MVMGRLVRAAAVFLCASAVATPALAQGGYVGAFLVGDVARFDQYDRARDDSGSGEALGFALRAGTGLGSRWGLELELVRPGEIENDFSPDVFPLTGMTISSLPSIAGLPDATRYDPLVFPNFSYRYRTSQRNTTLTTSLWVKQEVSARFSLAYLGGIAFGRTSREIEVSYESIRPLIPSIPSLPTIPSILPVISESTTYEVGPMVGVEGRIRLGGQVNLVPGIRLHAIEGGWLIRPAVGLEWVF